LRSQLDPRSIAITIFVLLYNSRFNGRIEELFISHRWVFFGRLAI
jgi:hypothetical protein